MGDVVTGVASVGSLTREQISLRVRTFIVDNFMFGKGADRLTDTQSFLETSIIDSTGVLELVAFVEDEFGVGVQDDELVPDNLDSIERVAAFVSRKLGVT
jgi:acyl carrier protein